MKLKINIVVVQLPTGGATVVEFSLDCLLVMQTVCGLKKIKISCVYTTVST